MWCSIQKLIDSLLFLILLACSPFQVSEIFNYSQDDLMTEDMLILDTHVEVFVWIGQSVDSKDKQTAFEIGQVQICFFFSLPLYSVFCQIRIMSQSFPQKYIDLAVSLEGLPPDIPLYRITEGNEPCFFTTYFCWDSAKTLV